MCVFQLSLSQCILTLLLVHQKGESSSLLFSWDLIRRAPCVGISCDSIDFSQEGYCGAVLGWGYACWMFFLGGTDKSGITVSTGDIPLLFLGGFYENVAESSPIVFTSQHFRETECSWTKEHKWKTFRYFVLSSSQRCSPYLSSSAVLVHSLAVCLIHTHLNMRNVWRSRGILHCAGIPPLSFHISLSV